MTVSCTQAAGPGLEPQDVPPTAVPPSEAPVGRILYGTQTGSAGRLAGDLAHAAVQLGLTLEVMDMARYEVEQLWKEQLVLVVVSTYEGGGPPEGARWFCQWLADVASDFRVGSQALSFTRFAVFGCGSSDYSEHFNQVKKQTSFSAWN